MYPVERDNSEVHEDEFETQVLINRKTFFS